MFISVRVSEIDFKERSSSSWVMNYASDDSFNITLTFSEIKISISWWGYSFGLGGGVD